MEGEGTLRIIMLNITYEGIFVGGKFHGHGNLKTNNGTYSGNFENGLPSGEGKMQYSNSDSYEGQWKTGLRHGQGTMNSQDGVYTGQWSKDLKDGIGRIEYCDGTVYEGNFALGKRHGKGTFKVTSENTRCAGIALYTGEWAYDTREGEGEIIYSTGDRYVGPLVGGLPHGVGKMFVAHSGYMFEAKFCNGMMEGKIDMLNKDKGEPILSLEPDGQVIGEVEGVEVLVPPFIPPLPF